MPAPASSRQPGTSSWFSGHGGQLLLDEERHWLAPRLAARPVQPRLWLAPVPPPEPEPAVPVPRGVLLYPHGAGYAGHQQGRWIAVDVEEDGVGAAHELPAAG